MTKEQLTARVFQERNELDAEVQLLRLQMISFTARLHAVEQERDRFEQLCLELSKVSTLGSPVPACPQCSPVLTGLGTLQDRGDGKWYCFQCDTETTRPTFYRQVIA
jgi:hypothetical protein